jgi:hypothetical protein
VLNGLSGIVEGDQVERLDAVVKDLGTNAGVKFSLLGAGIEFGGKGAKQTRKEIRFRATVHSRVAQFIRELEERHGIADLTKPQDFDNALGGMLVRFRARLSDLGFDGALVLPSPPTRLDRILGWDPFASATKDNKARFGGASRVSVVSFESDPVKHIGLELSAKALVVDRLEDLAGAVTVVGLVDWKCDGDRYVLVKRKAQDGEHLVNVERRADPPPGQAVDPPKTLALRGDALPDRAAQSKPEKRPAWWRPRKKRKWENDRARARAPLQPSTAPALPEDALKASDGSQVTFGVRPLLIFH